MVVIRFIDKNQIKNPIYGWDNDHIMKVPFKDWTRDRSDSIYWVCWRTEGKGKSVREEHFAGASGVPVV